MMSEALSRLTEALSSCPPRRSKDGTLLFHRPSAPSQDLPLWARQYGLRVTQGIRNLEAGTSRYPPHGTFGAPISFGAPGTFGTFGSSA